MSQRRPVTTPPINWLPFDVLSNIFFLALPSEPELRRSKGIGRAGCTDPIMLCGVCSLWQSFVFAAPQLWTQVFVHIDNISIAEAQSKAAELNKWIRRSGAHPLTLYVSHQCGAILTEGSIVSIVEVLNRYAARWEAMYFQSPNYFPGDKVTLSEWLRCEEWSALRRIYSFWNTDALPKNQSIPWHQLTHLHMSDGIAGREALDIFNQCPKLVNLSLNGRYGPSAFLTSPIILHDLETIELAIDDLSAVIQRISAPSLKEMVIERLWEVSTDAESLLAFLSRSACTLDRLKIKGEFGSDSLVCCLTHRSCYSLTRLEVAPILAFCAIDYGVLQGLTLREDDAYSICPHLKSLWLEFDCDHRRLSALATMVDSRLGPGRPVERRLDFLHLRISVDWRTKTFDGHLIEVVKRSKMQHDIRITNSNPLASAWTCMTLTCS